MSDSALRPERWEQFSELEVQVISGALATVLDAINEASKAGQLDADEAQGAAVTVLLGGRLLYSISDFKGEKRPTLSTLETIAGAISKNAVPS